MAALFLAMSCASAPATSPELALEWYELGNVWYDAGKWDRAADAYQRALAMDPRLKAANFNMIRALTETKDYDGALRAADLLLESDPKNVRVLTAKAFILYRKGDPVAALAAYEEVIKLEPYAPDAVYNAAFLRSEAGDRAKAAEDLGRLTKAKPEDTEALALYARLLFELDRRDEALVAYETLRTAGKADAAALERLGGLYAGIREFEKAIDALVASTAAEPGRASAWFSLARIRLVEADDGKAGLEALAKALEAGFADKKEIAALLESPSLAEREAVLAKLTEKGLGP